MSPFWGIEKAAVLQEARCFNDSQLDARKCQQVRGPAWHREHPPPSTTPVADAPRGTRTQVITKLLYLANQGDSFTKVRLLVAGRTRKCAPC